MNSLRKIVRPFSIRNLFLHLMIVFSINILLLYFVRPEHPIPCFFFAAILWTMTVEDFRSQLIDLRLVGCAAVLGVLMRPDAIREIFFLSSVGFFLPHLLQEMNAKFVPVQEGEQANFHFHSSHSGFTEDNAPPYLPCFLVGMVLCLSYYMLVLPIPSVFIDAQQAITFLISIAVQDSFTLFLFPFSLFLLSLGCYFRNRYVMKHGYNVVYRGLGDGDIYFLGMMIGAVGPFLVLGAMAVSLIPSAVQIWLLGRRLHFGRYR